MKTKTKPLKTLIIQATTIMYNPRTTKTAIYKEILNNALYVLE